MSEAIASRLRELARRAGLEGVPPSVVGGFAVIVGVAVLVGAWKWWPRHEARGDVSQVHAESRRASPSAGEGGVKASPGSAEAGRDTSATAVYVHVVGAVERPGLYRLTSGSRVADALRDAGGFADDAAEESVNLARVLSDGEQVVVPTRDELERAGVNGVLGAAGVSGGGTGSSSQKNGTPKSAATPPGGTVNINTADAAALDTLPGIGPSTASKIIADREANGRFASVDDLARVAGIGPKKLEQLRGVICVE